MIGLHRIMSGCWTCRRFDTRPTSFHLAFCLRAFTQMPSSSTSEPDLVESLRLSKASSTKVRKAGTRSVVHGTKAIDRAGRGGDGQCVMKWRTACALGLLGFATAVLGVSACSSDGGGDDDGQGG